MITGICTAFAAGVAKEWLDANQGGYVEHEDVLATLCTNYGQDPLTGIPH